jgi:aspartate carbamoyltransferase catalytic subunit
MSMIKEHLKGYSSYDEVRIAIVGDLVHQKITISNEQLIAVANFKRTC